MGACASLGQTDSPQVTPASIKRFVEYSPEIWRPSRADTPVAFRPRRSSLSPVEDEFGVADDVLLPNVLCNKELNSAYSTLRSKHSQDAETGEIDEQDNRVSVLSDVSDSTILEVTNPRNSLALLQERIALRQEFFRSERQQLTEQVQQALEKMETTETSDAGTTTPTSDNLIPNITTCNDLNSPSGASPCSEEIMANGYQETGNMDVGLCNVNTNLPVGQCGDSDSLLTNGSVESLPINEGCGLGMNISADAARTVEGEALSVTGELPSEQSQAQPHEEEPGTTVYDNNIDMHEMEAQCTDVSMMTPEGQTHMQTGSAENMVEHVAHCQQNPQEKPIMDQCTTFSEPGADAQHMPTHESLTSETVAVSTDACAPGQEVVIDEGNMTTEAVSVTPVTDEPGDIIDDDLPVVNKSDVGQMNFVTSHFDGTGTHDQDEQSTTALNANENDECVSSLEKINTEHVGEISTEENTQETDVNESPKETTSETETQNDPQGKTEAILQMGKELMEEGIRIQQHLSELKTLQKKEPSMPQQTGPGPDSSAGTDKPGENSKYKASYERMMKLKEEGDILRKELEEIGKQIPKKAPQKTVEDKAETESTPTDSVTPNPSQETSCSQDVSLPPSGELEEANDEDYDSDALLEEYNMVTHEDVEEPEQEGSHEDDTTTKSAQDEPGITDDSGVKADESNAKPTPVDFGKLKQTLKEWEELKKELKAKEAEQSRTDDTKGKLMAVSGDGQVVMVEQSPDASGRTIVTPMPNLRGVAKDGEVVIVDTQTGQIADQDVKSTGNFMGVNELGEITVLQATSHSQSTPPACTAQEPMLQDGQIVKLTSAEQNTAPNEYGNLNETADSVPTENISPTESKNLCHPPTATMGHEHDAVDPSTAADETAVNEDHNDSAEEVPCQSAVLHTETPQPVTSDECTEVTTAESDSLPAGAGVEAAPEPESPRETPRATDISTIRDSTMTTGNMLKIFRLTMNLQAEMGRMQIAMSDLQGQMRQTNAALGELSKLVINEMEKTEAEEED